MTARLHMKAKGSLDDRMKGLTSGAEDYMVKPFEVVELLARVNIVLRRYHKAEQVLKFEDLDYDTGLYPDNISTDYGDWYSWQATPCKALDTTFHTYAAYYWKIEFERYDGKKRHTLIISIFLWSLSDNWS